MRSAGREAARPLTTERRKKNTRKCMMTTVYQRHFCQFRDIKIKYCNLALVIPGYPPSHQAPLSYSALKVNVVALVLIWLSITINTASFIGFILTVARCSLYQSVPIYTKAPDSSMQPWTLCQRDKNFKSPAQNSKWINWQRTAPGLVQVRCLLLRWDGSCLGGTTSWTTYWLMPPVFTRSPTHTGTKKSHDIPASEKNK